MDSNSETQNKEVKFGNDDEWSIDGKLEGKEREGLFILAEAAGIPVYSATRAHEDIEGYPYVYWAQFYFSGTSIQRVARFTYEQVMEKLISIIETNKQ